MRFLMTCLAMATVSSAALAAPMNNADLIKLIKSGIGEPLILQSIDGSEPKFDTSANGLIQLKRAGASDAIMQRVMQREIAPVARAAKQPSPAAASASTPDGQCKIRASYNHIGIEDGGRFVDVGYQEASEESSVHTGSAILSVVTLGLTPVSGKTYAVLEGAHSDVRVKARRPAIVDLDAELGSKPGDSIRLVKLNVSDTNRSIPVTEASESLITSHEKTAFPSEMVMPLTFEPIEKACLLDGRKVSEYRAVPIQPLEPGEYAIAYGNALYYPFGVE